jgi:hypothetical protein
MYKHPPCPPDASVRTGLLWRNFPHATYLISLLKMFTFKSLLVVLILVPGFSSCFSQLPQDFPLVSKSDMPEGKFSASRTFNGTALFGYIDGGAELYLEYGFSVVSVTEIEYMQGRYKTEIYRMNGPEEAFGIFSVSKYRCLDMPSLSEFTCRTKYQLQFCKGQYYVSIINSTGTRSDSIASAKIGRIITDKINEKEVDLSQYLPGIRKDLLRTRCFLAKGRLGIVNGSPDLEDFFQRITDYTAVIVTKDGKKIVSLKFGNKESYQKFLELSHWEDVKTDTAGPVKKIADYHLLFELPG